MKLERRSVRKHGLRWHVGDDLCWWQYWVGVEHTWYWRGWPLFWRMKRRDRPMHEFIRRIA